MSNKKQYRKLNQADPEMIQMTDMSLATPVVQQHKGKYVQLNEQIKDQPNNKPITQKQSKPQQNQGQKQYPQQKQRPQINNQQRPSQVPPPPTYQNYPPPPQYTLYQMHNPLFPYVSYNYGGTRVYRQPSLFDTQIYSYNPQYQQLPRQGPKQKPQKTPQMKVACEFCTLEQIVPSNTQVFICCTCNNMNQCYPLHGAFICGKCQVKVWYPFGISQFMKCTKCNTVNRVPIEPRKTYQQKKQQKESEKSRDEQDNRAQFENVPVVPQHTEKQQVETLEFEDFPSNFKKEQKLPEQIQESGPNYPQIKEQPLI